MTIRIWGCRGSIPSPGHDTSLYGGNTTCVEVRLRDGTLIVIDAGTGIRSLGNALLKERRTTRVHLLITHAHWDHLQGFPFFVPGYLAGYTILVNSGPRAAQLLRQFLAHQLDPPYFPVRFEDLGASFEFREQDGEALAIGAARVSAIPLKHPDGGYGYEITEEGKRFLFLTDNEMGFQHPSGLADGDYVELCRKADLVLHDGQYTEEEYQHTRGWGHSTFRAVTDLGLAARVKRLGIFHHDPSHVDRDLDRYIGTCRERAARRGSRMELFGIREGMEIPV
jgi:phosphoribosyl 1,2-cyclic phosphodiesterase